MYGLGTLNNQPSRGTKDPMEAFLSCNNKAELLNKASTLLQSTGSTIEREVLDSVWDCTGGIDDIGSFKAYVIDMLDSLPSSSSKKNERDEYKLQEEGDIYQHGGDYYDNDDYDRGYDDEKPAPSQYEPNPFLFPPQPSAIDLLGNFICEGYPSEAEVIQFLEEYEIRDLNEKSSKGIPPLVWAIMKGRKDLVTLMVDRGADVNATTTKGNTMLGVALKLKGDDSVHRGSMVRLLLSKGANPDLLDSEEVDNMDNTTTIKYWLSRARKVCIHQPRVRQTFEKIDRVRLTEVFFSIVGQEFVIDEVIGMIYSKLVDASLSRKPVVLFLCGAPGHGKTNLAEDVMNVVAPNDHARVNCGDIVDAKWSLFGSEPGYVGATEGTGLSNFMEAHHNKFGVVVLEEFEKLGDSAKEALLHPFESGEWSVKKPGKTISVNCSKVIFIMTSNMMSKEIVAWFESTKAIQQYSEAESEEEKEGVRKWIMKEVGDLVKGKIKSGRVPEFARRIHVVPFGNFSKRECHVIAESMQDEISSRYAQPPRGDRLIGNLKMHFSPKYTKQIVDQHYDSMQGASSIVDTIKREVANVSLAVERKEPRPTHVWFYLHPRGYTHYCFTEPVEETEEVKETTSTPQSPKSKLSDSSSMLKDSLKNSDIFQNYKPPPGEDY